MTEAQLPLQNLGFACTSTVNSALSVIPYAELPSPRLRSSRRRRSTSATSHRFDNLLQSVDLSDITFNDNKDGCGEPRRLQFETPEASYAKFVRDSENMSPQLSCNSQSSSQASSEEQTLTSCSSPSASASSKSKFEGCSAAQREALHHLIALKNELAERSLTSASPSIEECASRADLVHAVGMHIATTKSTDEKALGRAAADDLAAIVDCLTVDIQQGTLRRSDTDFSLERRVLRDWDVYVGLQACLTVLHVFTIGGLPKTVFVDESINATIDFLKSVLLFYVYPVADPECTTKADPINFTAPLRGHHHQYRSAASSSPSASPMSTPTKRGRGRGSLKQTPTRQSPAAAGVGRGRGRGKKLQALQLHQGSVLEIQKTMPVIRELIKHIAQLFRVRAFTETQVFAVVGFSLQALALDNMDINMQNGVIELVYIIFDKYPLLRRPLLADYIETLCKLFAKVKGQGSRVPRTFRVGDVDSSDSSSSSSSGLIHMTSALSMLFVQGCSGLSPSSFQAAKLASPLSTSWWWESQTPPAKGNDYKTAVGVASQIVTILVERANHPKHHILIKRILKNLVGDWLVAFDLPVWPGAEVLLTQLCGQLASVMQHRPPFESTIPSLQALAVQLVGDVAARLRQEQMSAEATWLSLLKPRPPADEPPTQLACPCGTQNMTTMWAIECDACHHWFHGECVRVALPDLDGRPADRGVIDVPELSYVCEMCRARGKVCEQQLQIVQQWQRCSEIAGEQQASQGVDSQGFPTVGDDDDHTSSNNHGNNHGNNKAAAVPDSLVLTHKKAKLLMKVLGDVENPVFAAQQLVMNNLAVQFQHFDWIALSARQLYLSQWHEQACSSEDTARRSQHFHPNTFSSSSSSSSSVDANATRQIEKHTLLQHLYAVQWAVSPQSVYSSTIPVLNEAQLRAVVRWFSASRPLMLSFDALVSLLVQWLEDARTQHRAKAAKAVHQIIDTDPRLLLIDHLQHAVIILFNDDATSVREAAVSLVAQFLLERPEYCDRYLQSVNERIRDTSVKVRRRVVGFLMELCLKDPYHARVPELCRLLASRIHDDEESIRKLILRTFTELWFPANQPKLSLGLCLGVQSNVLQIMNVVRCGGHASAAQWLTPLLAAILVDSPRSVTQASKICNGLISHFIDLTNASSSSSSQGSSSSNPGNTADQETVIHALLLFGQVKISLIVPHLETLQVYLSSENTKSAVALQALSELFQRALPEVSHPRADLLRNVELQLSSLVCSSEFSTLHSALRSLCVVSVRVSNNALLINKLFGKFLSFLIANRHSTAIPSADIPRALTIVGLLCRYAHQSLSLPYNNNDDTPLPDDLQSPALFVEHYGPVLNVVFATLVAYSSSPYPQLRYFSLQAIGSLCLVAPQFLIKHQACLQNSLDPTASPRLKLCVLQIFQDVMKLKDLSSVPSFGVGENQLRTETGDENARRHLAEAADEAAERHRQQQQRRSHNTSDDNVDDKNSWLPDASRFQDAEVLGNITQALVVPFQKLIFDGEEKVRMSVVSLLATAYSFRLLNPVNLISSLIASLSDPNDKVVQKTSAFLVACSHQHSTSILSRLPDGLRLACHFQQILGINSTPSSTTSHLQVIYDVLCTNRGNRLCFFDAALKLFKNDDPSRPVDLQLVQYAAQQLLFLVPRYEEDPLYLVAEVNKLFAAQALRTLSRKKQLKPTLNSLSRRIVEDEDEDLVGVLAHDAIAASHLYALKTSLMAFHGLTAARCDGYSKETPLLRQIAVDMTGRASPFVDIPLVLSTIEQQRAALACFKRLWKAECQQVEGTDEEDGGVVVTVKAGTATASRAERTRSTPAKRAQRSSDSSESEYRPARRQRRTTGQTSTPARRTRQPARKQAQQQPTSDDTSDEESEE